ncbi:hypothetical protein Hanom_Chr11g01043001 [Helianthus anomalus]
MRKNKPLDESCKTDQTSGTKMAFYSKINVLSRSVTNHKSDPYAFDIKRVKTNET